ncbi:AMP-binding protein [Acetivibrio sp. MSJd-27]|jgi:acyl-coenzyme A synthetases/AMP-(fatty) acid ligases|uniref:AMP-binding protein n=1 Tax=Acetivibrio sp. MSJd-27 TaxID=2841523 RepID=UPI0015A7A532|nr:AMP-binding protein [Acetivibrio sp. MSJd-27]
MILDRFLPRKEFDSYEDFKENYMVNTPEDFNFGFDIVDGWAKEQKDYRALVWCNDHGEEYTFTYEQMSKLSNKAANFFQSKGLKKGSVVMLILRRRWEYWVCATALIKLGVIFIPGTLQLTKKDIAYRANAANIEMFLCVNDSYVVEQVEKALPEMPCVKNIGLVGNTDRDGWFNFNREIENCSNELERPVGENAVKGSDIMQIYFTSGTTGMPKMVMHNHFHPLGQIVTAKYWQRVQENKLHMSVSDSGWAKFGWGKIYGQWCCGATVFCYDMDKFIPSKLLEIMQNYKLTTFCAPPTMYRFMLQEDVKSYDLSSIENWATAGEPLNAEVFNRWLKLTGGKIHTGFGQTEGTVLFADFEWFEPIPGSMGKPSPIYDIRLVNENGEVCDSGEEGEIVIFNVKKKPPVGLFVGYYKNEEQTNLAMGDGNYNLKDVAWRDNNGYYTFVGRHDDVIKCSGYRIGPFEVESALIEHPAVVECAITAAPDPIRGQVVKATIVLAKGYTASDELVKELQNHVKKATAPYKYPRIVEFVDELPKTLGGKIKRAQIRNNDHK